MKLGLILAFGLLISLASLSFGQSADAYAPDSGASKSSGGLLDPSRFSVHQMVSFGASSGSGSSLKSQSLYTTMLQYRFASPVTLNLNFGLPIHSTYSSTMNLTEENVQSLDYFKSMPLDFALTWQPKSNLMMRFSVARDSPQSYYLGQQGFFQRDPIFGSW